MALIVSTSPLLWSTLLSTQFWQLLNEIFRKRIDRNDGGRGGPADSRGQRGKRQGHGRGQGHHLAGERRLAQAVELPVLVVYG